MKRLKGFTLIELLFSLTLLVILSASIFAGLNFFLNQWELIYSDITIQERLQNSSTAITDDLLYATEITLPNHKDHLIQITKPCVTSTENNQVSFEKIHYYLYKYPGKNTAFSLLKTQGEFNILRDYGKGTVLIDKTIVPEKTLFSRNKQSSLISFSVVVSENNQTYDIQGKVLPRNISKEFK